MQGNRTINANQSSDAVADAVLTTVNSLNHALLTSAGSNLPEETRRAVGILTLGAIPSNLDTVTVGAVTYTFETALTDTANFVLIGAAATNAIDNLIAAITNGAGEGTLYGTGTVANPLATAAVGAGDTMGATAVALGAAGNTVVTTASLADGSWADTTLLGGVSVVAGDVFFILPGEWAEVNRGPYVIVSVDTAADQWTIRKWEGGIFKAEASGTATIIITQGFFDASNQNAFRLEFVSEVGGTAVTVQWNSSLDGENWTSVASAQTAPGVLDHTGLPLEVARYVNALVAVIDTSLVVGYGSARAS